MKQEILLFSEHKWDFPALVESGTEFDEIEVHPMKGDMEPEQLLSDEGAEYWAVFAHVKHSSSTQNGGLVCIADCKQKKVAEKLAYILKSAFKNTL